MSEQPKDLPRRDSEPPAHPDPNAVVFYRKDTPTIMSGLVIRYKLREPYTGEISASREGVLVSGSWPVMGTAMIVGFMDMLMRADIQFQSMATRGIPAFEHEIDQAIERVKGSEEQRSGLILP